MDAPDPNAHDLAALQGVWRQVAFEENGVPDAPDSTGAPDALTIIDGDHFCVRTPQGEMLLEGRFMLDASVTPKAITWIDAMGPDAGMPLPASYRLEGDRFVFIAADAGAPRPTTFRTVPGLTMRSFVRHASAAAAGNAGR
ncbi:TIGR03067 domain-containing protein [Frateuria sp. GZRe14]|uniref:TIGR03067 domain-containing protein n=1 Tax=Frateuria sp. GZRe14 TaxID=3351534 RepID=UPI003EDC2CF0